MIPAVNTRVFRHVFEMPFAVVSVENIRTPSDIVFIAKLPCDPDVFRLHDFEVAGILILYVELALIARNDLIFRLILVGLSRSEAETSENRQRRSTREASICSG